MIVEHVHSVILKIAGADQSYDIVHTHDVRQPNHIHQVVCGPAMVELLVPLGPDEMKEMLPKGEPDDDAEA